MLIDPDEKKTSTNTTKKLLQILSIVANNSLILWHNINSLADFSGNISRNFFAINIQIKKMVNNFKHKLGIISQDIEEELLSLSLLTNLINELTVYRILDTSGKNTQQKKLLIIFYHIWSLIKNYFNEKYGNHYLIFAFLICLIMLNIFFPALLIPTSLLLLVTISISIYVVMRYFYHIKNIINILEKTSVFKDLDLENQNKKSRQLLLSEYKQKIRDAYQSQSIKQELKIVDDKEKLVHILNIAKKYNIKYLLNVDLEPIQNPEIASPEDIIILYNLVLNELKDKKIPTNEIREIQLTEIYYNQILHESCELEMLDNDPELLSLLNNDNKIKPLLDKYNKNKRVANFMEIIKAVEDERLLTYLKKNKRIEERLLWSSASSEIFIVILERIKTINNTDFNEQESKHIKYINKKVEDIVAFFNYIKSDSYCGDYALAKIKLKQKAKILSNYIIKTNITNLEIENLLTKLDQICMKEINKNSFLYNFQQITNNYFTIHRQYFNIQQGYLNDIDALSKILTTEEVTSVLNDNIENIDSNYEFYEYQKTTKFSQELDLIDNIWILLDSIENFTQVVSIDINNLFNFAKNNEVLKNTLNEFFNQSANFIFTDRANNNLNIAHNYEKHEVPAQKTVIPNIRESINTLETIAIAENNFKNIYELQQVMQKINYFNENYESIKICIVLTSEYFEKSINKCKINFYQILKQDLDITNESITTLDKEFNNKLSEISKLDKENIIYKLSAKKARSKIANSLLRYFTDLYEKNNIVEEAEKITILLNKIQEKNNDIIKYKEIFQKSQNELKIIFNNINNNEFQELIEESMQILKKNELNKVNNENLSKFIEKFINLSKKLNQNQHNYNNVLDSINANIANSLDAVIKINKLYFTIGQDILSSEIKYNNFKLLFDKNNEAEFIAEKCCTEKKYTARLISNLKPVKASVDSLNGRKPYL